jgi:Gram-negative bacterial TonB protein C-terminal
VRVVIWFAFVMSGFCLLAQEIPIMDEDVKPIFVEPLNYPLQARLQHVQGVVVILVRTDGSGNVVYSRVVSGPKSLISDCLSNSKKWRFQPSLEKAAVIVYTFKIEGLCKLPCSSQFIFRPPNAVSITVGDPIAEPAASHPTSTK